MGGLTVPRRSASYVVVCVALALGACSDSPHLIDRDALLGDVHQELLLVGETVRLAEGFYEFTALEVWKEYLERFNLDRGELPMLVPRPSRFVWELNGRAGVFVAGAARYHAGALADDGQCTVTVTALSGGLPLADVSATWELPVMPADEGQSGVDGHREGLAMALELAFPEGTEALEISVFADDTEPVAGQAAAPANYVTFLSPRIDREPASVGASHVYERQISLLPLVPAAPQELVPFGPRTTEHDGTVAFALPPWEVSGAFEGKSGRHALALTGEVVVVIADVEIQRGDVLQFGLALDRRLPPGTRARVDIAVGDKKTAVGDKQTEQGGTGDDLALLGSAEISSMHWRSLAWPLDDHVGEHRRLVVTVTSLALPSEDVEVKEPDFDLRKEVLVGYRPAVTRVGLSNLAIARTVTVPWRRASAERPSVLVVQVETLRADRLTATNAEGQVLMPSLNALARVGSSFTRALAPSPWTLPSTATLLTGLTPSAHGVVHHDRMVLPDDVPTLAERARAVGVSTGAVFTNDLLDPHKGYARGFDSCASVTYANARQVGQLARSFLDNHAERQFLLLLHYFDPHHPFRAPGQWRDHFVEPRLRGYDLDVVGGRMLSAMEAGAVPGPEHPDMRFMEQRQRGDIAYFDEHFGRLLDDLIERGMGDTTTVIVTADHGEEFGEQGWYGHGSFLYDECTRVPLVIAEAGDWADGWKRWRGADAGTRAGAAESGESGTTINAVVSTAGLHGEILRLLDISYDRDEILPALSQATPGTAFVETHKGLALIEGKDPFQRYLAGLRAEDRLVMLREVKPSERVDPDDLDDNWTWRFFELLDDGATVKPLPANGPRFEELKAQLQARIQWSTAHRARPPAAGTDSEAFEALMALGYVGAVNER